MEKRTNEVTFKSKPVTLVGKRLKAGDKAPDFQCLKGLEEVTLAQTPAKARLFSVVPSLDTPVCSMQTKKFDEALAALKDKLACYTVSLDLPFAQTASAPPRTSPTCRRCPTSTTTRSARTTAC